MNHIAVHICLLAYLGIAGALSAVVISEEELEASKPQLVISKSGNHLTINWESQADVYYFMEDSPDLDTWITKELIKDIEKTGNLALGADIISSKAFYRLSLEGDPNSARLRADDDGDKIINLLEANKGWDHLVAPNPVDNDNDGIPDYWENFHFETLDHDGTYVATPGGLTLAEAFAAGIDPKKIDSDGDGLPDAVDPNPNYDETRDDPNGDADEDGLTNAQEHAASTFPQDRDSDDDSVDDAVDGWPRDMNFTHAPVSESYALVDLSSKLPYPVAGTYDEETFSVQVDDFSGVLLSYATTEVFQSSTSTRNLVNKYYNWDTAITPTAFNGNKTVFEARPYLETSDNLHIHNLFHAHLTRSGIIRFFGEYGCNGSFAPVTQNPGTFIAELKATFAPNNTGFNTQAEQTEQVVTTLPENLLDPLTPSAAYRAYLVVSHSEYSDVSLLDVTMDRATSPERIVNLVKNVASIFSYNVDDEDLGNSYGYSYSGSGIGREETVVYEFGGYSQGDPSKFALISDAGDIAHLTGDADNTYGVISKEGQDILVSAPSAGAKQYSLDDGATFHPSQAWNLATRELEEVSFVGKSSDDLVILQSNQTSILINGQIKTAKELLGKQAENWTDFKLHDINSDGMIVGTALHSPEGGSPARKVVALLKVELDPVYGDGPDEFGYCSSSIGDDAMPSCEFENPALNNIVIGGAINQVPNPAAIVIEGSYNDENVAVFKLKVEGVTDEQAENMFHWQIEPEGGEASFHPDASHNKGKTVKVRGDEPGRIRLNVRASSSLETDPVRFIEAVVVNKKTLPYRANVLNYNGNDNPILPLYPPSKVTDSISLANIILRQGGIELVQSSNTNPGNQDRVVDTEPLDGNIGFELEVDSSLLVEQVFYPNEYHALAANYLPDLFQISFIQDFHTGAWARNFCRPGTTLTTVEGPIDDAQYYSAAYKTSDKDEDDESIVHKLRLFEASLEPTELDPPLPYPNLYGAMVGWKAVNGNRRKAGYSLAHEVLHALNLVHREGYLTDQENVDGLEDKYLGPDGTNIMDYYGGIDFDLLQVLIARGSPLLQ